MRCPIIKSTNTCNWQISGLCEILSGCWDALADLKYNMNNRKCAHIWVKTTIWLCIHICRHAGHPNDVGKWTLKMSSLAPTLMIVLASGQRFVSKSVSDVCRRCLCLGLVLIQWQWTGNMFIKFSKAGVIMTSMIFFFRICSKTTVLCVVFNYY